MFFHVFRHVNPHEIRFIVKEDVRQRTCQFRFAHSRRPKKQKGSNRSVGVLDARPGTKNRVGNRPNAFLLTHDALMEQLAQLQEFFQFFLKETADWNTRPAAHDFGNVFGIDFFLEKP